MRTQTRRFNLTDDPVCSGLIYDHCPALFIRADYIGRARNQFWVVAQILPLFVLQTLYGTAFDHGVISGLYLRLHTNGIGSGFDLNFCHMRLHLAGFFNDPVTAQHALPFQHGPQLHMYIIENIPRLFQIRAALKVQFLRLGHLGKVIRDPLMLERGVLRPCLHPGHNLGCADPRAAQGRIDAGPHPWLRQTLQFALLNIGFRINPAF